MELSHLQEKNKLVKNRLENKQMSLHKCLKCGTYTLQETCSKCKEKAVSPAPARFSIEHSKKYGKYRRALMKKMKEEQENK